MSFHFIVETYPSHAKCNSLESPLANTAIVMCFGALVSVGCVEIATQELVTISPGN